MENEKNKKNQNENDGAKSTPIRWTIFIIEDIQLKLNYFFWVKVQNP